MGLEAAYVPYIVSAVGALGGAANQAHAMKKKDNKLAEGILQQGRAQQEAATKVNQNVEAIAASDPADARKKSNQQLMEALQRNRAGSAVPSVMGASARYQQGVAQGNESVGDFASQLGDSYATVDSAQRQREGEAQGTGRAADAIGMIQRRAAGDAGINRLQADRIQPNPWVALASSVAQNIGKTMASGGAGKAFGGKVPTGAGLPKGAYQFDPFGADAAQVYG